MVRSGRCPVPRWRHCARWHTVPVTSLRAMSCYACCRAIATIRTQSTPLYFGCEQLWATRTLSRRLSSVVTASRWTNQPIYHDFDPGSAWHPPTRWCRDDRRPCGTGEHAAGPHGAGCVCRRVGPHPQRSAFGCQRARDRGARVFVPWISCSHRSARPDRGRPTLERRRHPCIGAEQGDRADGRRPAGGIRLASRRFGDPCRGGHIRYDGGRRVVCASYLLAEAVSLEPLRACGPDLVRGTLGTHPGLAQLIANRFRTA